MQHLLEAIEQGLSSLPEPCPVHVPAASESFGLVSHSHSEVTFIKIHFEPLPPTGKVRKCVSVSTGISTGTGAFRQRAAAAGSARAGRTPGDIWGLWWSWPRQPCSPSPGLGRRHEAGGSGPCCTAEPPPAWHRACSTQRCFPSPNSPSSEKTHWSWPANSHHNVVLLLANAVCSAVCQVKIKS